jgi:hypothetical protein
MAWLKIQNIKLKKVAQWLLEVLFLIFLLWLLFIMAGRALCHIALGQIAEITNTKIEEGPVRFRTDCSVIIKDLVIRPYETRGDDEAILEAETVYAHFSLGSVLLLKPQLKVIYVEDFVFNTQYDLDTGWWNLSALNIRPPKGSSGKIPRISLENGTLQYSKIEGGKTKVALSVPINARFGPDEKTKDTYSFDITTSTLASGYGNSHLSGLWKPGVLTVAGGISSLDVPELEMAWLIDILAAELQYDEDKNFSLKLRMKDLISKGSPSLDKLALVGPAFLERSTPFVALQKFFNRYQPYGRVNVNLDVSGNLSRLRESEITGDVYCKDVAFCYYKFPYIVEHLTGRVDFTKNSITINNLSGKHDNVELFFNGWSQDFGPNWKCQVRVNADNVVLDNDLYNALSPAEKKSWKAFSPAGFASVDYLYHRKSKTDKGQKLAADFHDAQAIYKHFPYPLKNITGQLFIEKGDVIFSDIVSQLNGSRITFNGQVTGANSPDSRYDISIDLDNVPLDSKLQASLPDSQQRLYSRIRPTGYIDGLVAVSQAGSEPVAYTADLFFRQATLKSDKFSLPVTDISANAVFTPDLINIKHFSGRYNRSPVSLVGTIWPGEQTEDFLYRLSLEFGEIALDSEFFNLLPDSTKETVEKFKPQGKINLVADLDKESGTSPPDYRVTIECLNNTADFPQSPYPLKDINGTLSVTKDKITFNEVYATLDNGTPDADEASTIEVSGRVAMSEDAFDSADLKLSIKDIALDEKNRSILPQHIQPLCEKFSPDSRFDLDFEDFRIDLLDDGRKSIDFTGVLKFKGCDFNASDTQIRLDALLKIEGLYTTGRGFDDYNVAFDGGTVRVLDKAFDNVKADIVYDPALNSWCTEGLVADCYTGKATGKVELRQLSESVSEYLVIIYFDNVDIQQFLSDTEAQKIPEGGFTTGKMKGSLSLSARSGNSSSRVGTCKLAITDMQVGHNSPLGRLLQVLQLTEPKDHVFDQMFLDSYIRRDNLLVEKLDLSGRSVAFYGSGRMNLKTKDINLSLIARGRRAATDDPSILQSLTEGLGRAVIRMEVTGDMYDPKVETKTLPVLKDTLEILGTKPASYNQ